MYIVLYKIHYAIVVRLEAYICDWSLIGTWTDFAVHDHSIVLSQHALILCLCVLNMTRGDYTHILSADVNALKPSICGLLVYVEGVPLLLKSYMYV